MPDVLHIVPTVVSGDVIIARLHGEACFYCGAVNKALREAGHVVVRGSTRVWPIVTCGCRTAVPPCDCRMEATDPRDGLGPGAWSTLTRSADSAHK